ncbi:MAG: hypothetical protein NZM41_11355 [Saprospiraceae bacterium]|nr:hypothetical protein [Saprospiraceae bacterium]
MEASTSPLHVLCNTSNLTCLLWCPTVPKMGGRSVCQMPCPFFIGTSPRRIVLIRMHNALFASILVHLIAFHLYIRQSVLLSMLVSVLH